MLLGILRSLIWIWPFISEMFFSGKPFKTLLKERWGSVVILVLLGLSLFVNYVSLAKIYQYASANKTNPSTIKVETIKPDPAKQHDRDVEEAKEKLKNIYLGVEQ